MNLHQTTPLGACFVSLFVLLLYIPDNNFSVMLGCFSYLPGLTDWTDFNICDIFPPKSVDIRNQKYALKSDSDVSFI